VTSLGKQIKVISCDLDDALYDNQPVLAHAEQICINYLETEFQKQSCSFDPDEFRAIRKKLLASDDIQLENMNVFRRKALTEFCQPLANRETIVDLALQRFLHARSLATIEPDIKTMLETLSSKFILVSITNGNCDPNRLSIGSFFDRNYSPLDGFRAKPHPQMLQQVLRDYAIQPKQLLHIGDALDKDGVAAEAAGAHFIQFAPFLNGQSVKKVVNFLLKQLFDSSTI